MVVEINNSFNTIDISKFSEVLVYITIVVLVLIDMNINLCNNI
jgi:hypothetical protein